MKTKRNEHVPKFTVQMTWPQFERMFPHEDACRQYLMDQHWPDGVKCPRCLSGEKVYALKSIRQPWKWECRNKACCNGHAYRFSVLVGTIFEDTKIPLRKWFWVLFLMLTSKKGMSALQIHRVIEVGSYHTTFFICHRLRAGLKDPEFRKLMGIVEVDETYIGGKDRNRHWNKKSAQRRAAAGVLTGLEKSWTGERFGYGKVGVIGAIARKGNVVAQVIGDAGAETLSGFVRNVVSDKVSLLATDEKADYNYVDPRMRHEAVKHSANEYVRGEVHTNNIESFWSLLKRGVVGTYHNVSKKYLPLYINEFAFRYNNRENPDIFGKAIAGC